MGEGSEDRMIGDELTSESNIYWLSTLKKDLNNFGVDSNLKEVGWVMFILESDYWLLEIKDDLDDEIVSTSLIVKGMKGDTLSRDEGCKVAKLFLGMKESNEE